MRTFLKLTCTFLLIFSFVACQEDPVVEPDTVSEEEAVEAIEALVSSEDAALAADVAKSAEMTVEAAGDATQACGQTGDSTVVYQYAGTNRSYDFTASYQWEIFCNSFDLPESALLQTNRTGNYEGPRVSHSGEATSALALEGLSSFLIDSLVQVEGSHSYAGTATYLIKNKTLTVALAMNLENLVVNVVTPEIMGGMASFTLILENNAGTQTYAGSITFLGDGQAEVTLNGQTYPISV